MLDANKISRMIDAETVEMTDHDRALVRKGSCLTLRVVNEEMGGFLGWLKNSEPDLIAVTPTVRR